MAGERPDHTLEPNALVNELCLRLFGAHPDQGNRSAEECAATVKAVLGAVSVPIIIWGCGQADKDNEIMPRCSEAAAGENCLLGTATQDNYKTITAACMADGHKLITEAPIDINIQKQVNILVSEMGMDLSRIVIPNRKIVGEILHNFGKLRQLDVAVGVAYDTDLGAAVGVVREVLQANPRVLREPSPVIGVSRLADSSVRISIGPWVAVPDYVAATSEVNRAVLEAFRARQIRIALPQREVRLLNAAA